MRTSTPRRRQFPSLTCSPKTLNTSHKEPGAARGQQHWKLPVLGSCLKVPRTVPRLVCTRTPSDAVRTRHVTRCAMSIVEEFLSRPHDTCTTFFADGRGFCLVQICIYCILKSIADFSVHVKDGFYTIIHNFFLDSNGIN